MSAVAGQDPPTLYPLLRAARRALAEAGVPEAELEGELLLAHALGTDRAGLWSRMREPVPPGVEERLAVLLRRRRAREPLAYILGEREFFGLKVAVGPGVMVPRPETEGLVETALAWARARSPQGEGLVVADVGTGSGCIALALAVHLPRARLYATDLSPAALEWARRTLGRHGLEGRVRLLQGDLLAPLPEPVDAAVANLPYIPSARLPFLAPEVRVHEPRLALDGGPDGLDLYRRLLAQAPGYLRPGGALFLEADPEQMDALEALARHAFPGARLRRGRDPAGGERFLTVEVPGP